MRAAVGVLHPGAMGASLGAALVGAGHEVRWVSQGRSEATSARARADGLTDAGTLEALVDRAEVLISVCPPGAAVDVARSVADLGFAGTYVDANAVAPATARTIEQVVTERGARMVDGGIVGPPARHRGLTVLYLSGPSDAVTRVAELFADGPAIPHPVDGAVGAASAVKMAFAAWTKGSSALLLAVRALAEREGVVDDLAHAWSVLTPDLATRVPDTASGTAPKAWRFVGEMEEIAASFADAGLPDGFHLAAAEVYARLADLRDRDDVRLDEVLQRLSTPPD